MAIVNNTISINWNVEVLREYKNSLFSRYNYYWKAVVDNINLIDKLNISYKKVFDNSQSVKINYAKIDAHLIGCAN